MASSPVIKALGLNISQNPLEVNPGTLSEASNIIIRRDDVVESRRGFGLYGTAFGTSSDRAKQLANYKLKILRHYSNKLQVEGSVNNDGDVEFFDLDGTVVETQTGLRVKSIEANGNFYVTTNEGIKKVSVKSNSDFSTSTKIRKAGATQALDLRGRTSTTLGFQGGFLPQNSLVSYKVVWGEVDANNNTLLGTPSEAFTVYNYQIDLLLQDYNRLLSALSYVSGSGLFSNTDYMTLQLPITASSEDLRVKLLALTTKIDNDLVFTPPLAVSGVTFTTTVATVTFGGDPSTYIRVGDKIELTGFGGTTLNGTYTVTVVNSPVNTIQFNVAAGTTYTSAGTIKSNLFRSITEPLSQTVPEATQLQLDSLSEYLNAIISQLKNLPTGVLPTLTATRYINPLTLTTTANVILDFTIPDDIELNRQFYQIYRTSVSTATGTQRISETTIPTDYQIIDEVFPNSSELSAQIITYTDTAAEGIVGASLYANTTSPNEPPPFALDINRFKNYVFYANTKIKQNKTFTLASTTSVVDKYNKSFSFSNVDPGADTITINSHGLSNGRQVKIFAIDGLFPGGLNSSNTYYIVNSTTNTIKLSTTPSGPFINITTTGSGNFVLYLTDDSPKLTIATITNSNTYEFVLGSKQITKLVCGDASGLNQGTTGSYFIIYSASDAVKYYVWYNKTDIPAVDPKIANSVGIRVDVLSTDLAAQVATKTYNTLAAYNYDFIVPAPTIIAPTDLYIYTTGVGVTTASSTISGAFIISTYQSGAGEDITNKKVLLSNDISVGIAVEDTIKSLIRVANRTLTEVVYGFYQTGISIKPGTVLFQGKELTTSEFTLVSNEPNLNISLIPNLTSELVVDVLPPSVGNPTIITTVFPHGLLTGDKIILTNTKPSFLSGVDVGLSLTGTVSFVTGSSNVVGSLGTSFTSQVNPGDWIKSAAHPDFYYTKVLSVNSDTSITLETNYLGPMANTSAVVNKKSIDGIYTITRTSPSSFNIPANVTSFTNIGGVRPSYSSVLNAQSSSSDEQPHRIFYSKFLEPEAAPLLNFIDVGTNDRKILRIVPLRDSLFIFKEDGLYRLSGETEPFVVSLFDSSCVLLAPDSIGIANNQIYCWTTQGISIVTEAGVSVISRPIDVDILKTASSQYTNFKTATWGVGYDSDNSYIVYTVKNPSDTKAEIAYRFSNLTSTWTTYDKTAICGIVNFADDKLYFGAGDTNYIEKERKTFSRYDYTDRELDYYLNTNSYFSTILKFPVVSTASVGDVLVQNQTITTYNFNSLLEQLDNDALVPTTNFFSLLQLSGGQRPRTNLESLGLKLSTDLSNPGYSNKIQSRQGIAITQVDVGNPGVITSASHGLETGRWITISGVTGVSPSINGTYQVTVTGLNTFSIGVNVTIGATGLSGVFSTLDDDPRDLKTSFNLIVSTLNTDPAVGYSNYQQITDETVQECIVSNVDLAKKEITTNVALDFLVGPVSLFKAIPCSLRYNPMTMGDPLMLKHLRESTLMFTNKAFSSASINFSTDLQPEVIEIDFNGDGNGIFGHSPFGLGFFGGSSNSAPFRTMIPRNCQRCRFILVGFTHSVAREEWSILGMTLTGEVGQSPRAYR